MIHYRKSTVADLVDYSLNRVGSESIEEFLIRRDAKRAAAEAGEPKLTVLPVQTESRAERILWLRAKLEAEELLERSERPDPLALAVRRTDRCIGGVSQLTGKPGWA